MFVLCSHIAIVNPTTGQTVTFSGVNGVRIRKGIHSLIQTASITIPLSARLKQKDAQTATVQTSNVFNRNDKVTIRLGYNGKLKTEFVGFISRVDMSSPCVIECEGYSYLLKQKVIKQTFKSGTMLRDILSTVTNGVDVVLSNQIPSIALGSELQIGNRNALDVIDHLCKTLLLTAYFTGNELYVGLQQTNVKQTVKYRMGYNVIKDNSLKYHVAEQNRVRVVLKTANSEGGKEIYSTGDPDGEVHEYVVRKIASNNLKSIAETHLSSLKFSGYEGKITGFLSPYCEHGWAANIEDLKYPERDGTYFVDSVEVSYGTSGARRIVELSRKLSNVG